jgi:hypothetical protein
MKRYSTGGPGRVARSTFSYPISQEVTTTPDRLRYTAVATPSWPVQLLEIPSGVGRRGAGVGWGLAFELDGIGATLVYVF